MATVRDNQAAGRYELDIDGVTAIAVYERRGDVIAFTHTEAPAALQGRGVASALVKGALADVRRRGLAVLPLCSFVASYIERHAEERDLLADTGGR